MKNLSTKLIALTAAFVLLSPAYGQTLTVKSSDTLLPLGQKWAAAFKEKNPAAALEVTGGGATAAFAALAEKKLDVALVSRSIRHKEAQACVAAFGQRPVEYKVAVNAVVVYVHTNNPVKTLTYDEMLSLFSGQSKNWKEFDGGEDLAVAVYAQETNSIPGEVFTEEILGTKKLSADARILSGAEMLKAIAADPKAIGYGAFAQADGVRPPAIKRVFSSKPVVPNETSITNRVYPISRFVYCYVNPAATNSVAKAWLDWVRGDEGQRIAREAGFFPTSAKWRTSP